MHLVLQQLFGRGVIDPTEITDLMLGVPTPDKDFQRGIEAAAKIQAVGTGRHKLQNDPDYLAAREVVQKVGSSYPGASEDSKIGGEMLRALYYQHVIDHQQKTGAKLLDESNRMLPNWFKINRSRATVRDATADLERFLLALKGMSDGEIGAIVALAAILRIELRQQNLFPDEALGVGMPLPEMEQNTLQANLAHMVVDLQKKNSPSAGGAVVWLHSLRAFRYPEVRLLGRQMWGELERGFPHVFDAFHFIEETVRQPLPSGAVQASQFIPVGLEPIRAPRDAMPP